MYENDMKIIERAQNGSKEDMTKLIEDNSRLVWSIVRRFNGRGYDIEDLYQIGSIGLIKAIQRFDTSFEVRLSTYAVPYILGEIKRFIRDDGPIKVSRSIKELNVKINELKRHYLLNTGKEITIEQICKELKVQKEDVIIAMESTNAVESMDAAANAENKDGTIYIPITELEDVYGIEIKYLPDSKVLTVDSTSKEQKKAIITKNVAVKSSTKFIAKTIDRVKKGSYVIVVSEDKGYTKIRTENGKVGYVKSNKIANTVVVREEMQETKQITGKVNLVWDYYSEVASAPDRTGVTMDGVNVVSPAFFHLNTNGELTENVGQAGVAYIEWAHSNGYKVWPMVQNAGDGMLNVTSNIMNDYNKRQNLINKIVDYCVKYKLDGINVDFENMKQEDKDMYSRFIIELTPRLKDMGVVVSVDVTAPDGSETWSMCFDRNVIGDVADYIIFMAYDEYGDSSTKAGTTAGYDWVELGLKKFLETEEVEPEKLILAVPLYTRLWTEDSSGKVTKKSVVSMKDIDRTIPSDVEKQWNDKLKQYYVEYKDGNNLKKMWIEDLKSLKEKVSLISKYKLGGLASWEKGMETDDVWNLFKEALK